MGFYTTISPEGRTAGEQGDWVGTDEDGQGNLGEELHTATDHADATSDELHNMVEGGHQLASNAEEVAYAAAGA